ncbi:Hypothetical predicted protein [Mytilus galloprovincialis]|uniref:Ig-like domain-containing protein n=1 Tax=Mytilus galloprovincialis TaxID=29158 RepID=A0A8B6FR20_MYTGA|nr:Hypothetical predicted protein [Mytilus galloprovincialis]
MRLWLDTTRLRAQQSPIQQSEPTVKILTDRTVNITEDGTLLLQCNYTSSDDINTYITWKYTSNGHNKYFLPSSKSLKIEHIKRTDADEYTCVVSNSAGKANDTVTVNVVCKYTDGICITSLSKTGYILAFVKLIDV